MNITFETTFDFDQFFIKSIYMNMHFGFNTKFSALRAEIYIYEHLYMKTVILRPAVMGTPAYMAYNMGNPVFPNFNIFAPTWS